ncbi:hypothetical protein ANN_07877 [Periplaneta americana]|uniref:Transposase Tc1-like domain-containing protein n=1 Tax=Periplaneta americana TaxID=6978 RepID=A0ABQ8SZU2_PERAM|nr:hypothetical protein ANN_07877 [Periplaneta americana]
MVGNCSRFSSSVRRISGNHMPNSRLHLVEYHRVITIPAALNSEHLIKLSRTSVPQIRVMIEESSNTKISNQTIRRVLWKNGCRGTRPRKRPYISETNQSRRLDFDKEHVGKNEEFWNRVIWSNEMEINLYGSDGIHRIWRYHNIDNDRNNTLPNSETRDGCILLWGCMSANGAGNIEFKDVIMNIRLTWAGHVARMGESRNVCRVLVGRPEGKRPLGRPRRRWEDNIKMDLREVGYDDRDWINLAQDRDRWRAYVRAAMNLRCMGPVPTQHRDVLGETIGSEIRLRMPAITAGGDHRANHTVPPFWLDDRSLLLRHVGVSPAAGWSV